MTATQTTLGEVRYVDALELIGSLDLLLTDIPYAHVSRPSGGLRNLDKDYADTEKFRLLDLASRDLLTGLIVREKTILCH